MPDKTSCSASQALAVFMKCLLRLRMVGDRFLSFVASQSFSLCGRETGISASVVDHFRFALGIHSTSAGEGLVTQQPTPDGLILVSPVARESVFVLYLHCERFGLFVRSSQLLGKRTPLPNDIVPGTNLFHFQFRLQPRLGRFASKR